MVNKLKRSPLKRKTPLKAKKSLQSKTPLKAKKSLESKTSLKTYSTLKTKTPLKSSGEGLSTYSSLKPVSDKKKAANAKNPPKKRNSMKGHGRKKVDIDHHTKLVANGCMACNHEGLTPYHPIQIHHPDGRSRGKEGDYKERFAIALCAEHHDQRIYNGFYLGMTWMPADRNIPSIHHNKKGFIELYGSESLLVHKSFENIEETPPWLSESEWKEFLDLKDDESREIWLRDNINAHSAKSMREKTGS